MADAQIAIPITIQADVIRARKYGRELARDRGLGMADQTRFATVISELTRNALIYAGQGLCEISSHRGEGTLTLTVRVTDQGPGIADIKLAMTPGYSTGSGLGAGLPGVRRLMDRLDIESKAGDTRVEASMVRRCR